MLRPMATQVDENKGQVRPQTREDILHHPPGTFQVSRKESESQRLGTGAETQCLLNTTIDLRVVVYAGMRFTEVGHS